MWDVSGNRFQNLTTSYRGSKANSKGAQVGGTFGEDRSLAFLRVCSGVVTNSRVPTIAGGCNGRRTSVLEWNFNGDLTDASGNGYTAMSVGQPVYIPTPYQQLFAVIKTAGAPVWSNWVSLRAGYPNRLDGTSSGSQSDIGSVVACSWQLLSGPSSVTWDNPNSCKPVVNGLVFGDYEFMLTVTDPLGQQASKAMHIGAVAMDDDRVVIPADPRVTEIFGPMIAFGKNPWGYADERAYAAVKLQSQNYANNWSTPHSWTVSGQGTVSYPWVGVGPPPGFRGTRLNTQITSVDTTLEIVDASPIDLSSMPVWILVGDTIGQQELIRICDSTASKGPATLTVCYDGRGMSGQNVIPARAWPPGTTVGQFKVTGEGTLFASDPQAPLCPAGAPGPAGRIKYLNGSVAGVGGSTTITGFGTSWDASTITVGDFIRVEATHGGGNPFVWWSTIQAVIDGQTLSVDRPFPSDVDPGPSPYKIVGRRYIVLHFTAPDGADQVTPEYTQGCESETAAYALATHDVPAINNVLQSGKSYSYVDSLGAESAFGVNFYGSGFANRAFYYRSGLKLALDTANMIDDDWVTSPELSAGWTGGIPLLQGGGVIGAFANLILNPDTKLKWAGLGSSPGGPHSLESLAVMTTIHAIPDISPPGSRWPQTTIPTRISGVPGNPL